MHSVFNFIRGFVAIVAVLGVLGSVAVAQNTKKAHDKEAKPSIVITKAPDVGGGETSFGDIAGVVKNAPKGCTVVLWSFGDTWYIQPYANAPFTVIGKDGKFSATIHGGDEFAALLVKVGYEPPSTTGTLPTVGGKILAIARVKRKMGKM